MEIACNKIWKTSVNNSGTLPTTNCCAITTMETVSIIGGLVIVLLIGNAISDGMPKSICSANA